MIQLEIFVPPMVPMLQKLPPLDAWTEPIPSENALQPPAPLGARRATPDRLDGKYRYLHLGRMPVAHADSLLICGSRGSLRTNFCLTPLFDPKRPKRLYDFHVLIAFAPDKSHIKIAEVVAIPTEEDAKDDKPQKRDAAKDHFDALV